MGRPKKDTTANTTKATKPATEAPNETELLKAQLEELKAQMAAMAQAQPSVASAPIITYTAPQVNQSKRNIRFVSLTLGGLSLKGTRFIRFEKQFESKMIPESEARTIVLNMPKTIASGMVYIADAQFIAENELEDIYQNLLSDKQMNDLLNHDVSYVCEVYKNACDEQKEIIVNMISDKKMQGGYVDANILVELGKLTGKPLMEIEPFGEE